LSMEWFKSVSKEVSILFIELYETVTMQTQFLMNPQVAPIISTSTHGLALIAFVVGMCGLAIALSVKQRQARTQERAACL